MPRADETQAQEILLDAMLPVLDRMTGRAKSEGFDEDENGGRGRAQSGGRSEKRTQFPGSGWRRCAPSCKLNFKS
ncbi:MAG: hypothetical protein IPG44_12580 [Anaerolineales bacterium]|nr:hypothetical protein [Anaerolineales bacterium]